MICVLHIKNFACTKKTTYPSYVLEPVDDVGIKQVPQTHPPDWQFACPQKILKDANHVL